MMVNPATAKGGSYELDGVTPITFTSKPLQERMRTTTADVEYTGGQRLYGQVEGDLLWTFDRATTNHQLQPYLWARLQRVA